MKRRYGVSAGRNGIFIGTPRLLDVTWGRRVRLTFRTYDHVLIFSLKHLPRVSTARRKEPLVIPRTVPIVCARSKQPRGRSIAYRLLRWDAPKVTAREASPDDEWLCACCGQRVKVTW